MSNVFAETRELAKLVKQIKGRLEPVFITDMRRTVRLLHLDGNSVVEAAIDVGRIRAGAASEPVSELELELKGRDLGPMYRCAGAEMADPSLPRPPTLHQLHLGRTGPIGPDRCANINYSIRGVAS
jgi:hypothetical protein